MAAFVSAISGNWNDGATWGNTSPGVKGTDWPGSAVDTFTVAAGHTVTYNVSEANELGASTINGVLTFVTNASTKLAFGNVSLTISSTGELKVGASGAVIDKAYTAEIIFNTTADNAQGISCANGGKYSFYGDPTYCSDWETTLADDAENTDGDTSIKTVDDMSAIWHVGDELLIKVEKLGDSTSYTDAVKAGVIQSMSGTTIVLDINITAVAGVGSTWIALVINVTRNVRLYKSTVPVTYTTNDVVQISIAATVNGVASKDIIAEFVIEEAAGANAVTITVQEADLTPIPDVSVQILNSGQTLALKTGTTDASGQVVVALNDGTYKVRLSKAMANFTTPETLVVSGATSEEFTGAPVSPTAPSTGLQTLYVIPTTLGLAYSSTMVISAAVSQLNEEVDTAILTNQILTGVDMTTHFELQIAKGAVVTIAGWNGTSKFLEKTITIDTNDTKNLVDYL